MNGPRHATCRFLFRMMGLGTLTLGLVPLAAADDVADLGKSTGSPRQGAGARKRPE